MSRWGERPSLHFPPSPCTTDSLPCISPPFYLPVWIQHAATQLWLCSWGQDARGWWSSSMERTWVPEWPYGAEFLHQLGLLTSGLITQKVINIHIFKAIGYLGLFVAAAQWIRIQSYLVSFLVWDRSCLQGVVHTHTHSHTHPTHTTHMWYHINDFSIFRDIGCF